MEYSDGEELNIFKFPSEDSEKQNEAKGWFNGGKKEKEN